MWSVRRQIGPRDRSRRPVPPPRLAAQDFGGVAASHRALSGAILSIECARTHTHAISTGAGAVFMRFGVGSRLCESP